MTAHPIDDAGSTTGRPVRVGATATPDPAVVALGRALRRTQDRVETIDRGLAALAADVAAVRDRPVGSPAGDGPGEEEADPVRSWLLANDPEQAVADLADLVAWVGRIYLRFSRAHLSSCWLWHPDAVEELWCLRGAHADAFHPETGSWMRAGDWHDRQRPGVERRLNALLSKCSLSRHVARNGRTADVIEPAAPPLGRHHAAVAVWWAEHGEAGPSPTAELLAEAERVEYPDGGR